MLKEVISDDMISEGFDTKKCLVGVSTTYSESEEIMQKGEHGRHRGYWTLGAIVAE